MLCVEWWPRLMPALDEMDAAKMVRGFPELTVSGALRLPP